MNQCLIYKSSLLARHNQESDQCSPSLFPFESVRSEHDTDYWLALDILLPLSAVAIPCRFSWGGSSVWRDGDVHPTQCARLLWGLRQHSPEHRNGEGRDKKLCNPSEIFLLKFSHQSLLDGLSSLVGLIIILLFLYPTHLHPQLPATHHTLLPQVGSTTAFSRPPPVVLPRVEKPRPIVEEKSYKTTIVVST